MTKYSLVTGGAGFIGSNLVARLVQSGNKVIVIDNFETGSLNNLRDNLDKVVIIPGDCSKIEAIELPELEVIYHLGIPSSSPMYKEDPKLVGETIKAFTQILERVKQDYPNVKIIYASTSSIYNGNETPFREDMPVYIKDYYTECRYAMERLAQLYYNLHKVKSIGLRFFSVYGPHEEYKKGYANMVTQFLWKLRSNEIPVVYGDGTQSRDFIYVQDAIDACIQAARSEIKWSIFNVGTGVETSFNKTIELLKSRLKASVNPQYVRNPIKNYVQTTLADIKKAQIKLGFTAGYILEKGIDKTIQYYSAVSRD